MPSPTPAQQRAAKARATFRASFPDDQAHAEHMQQLAARSADRRRGGVILSAADVQTLADAYDTLPDDHRAALGAAYDLLRRVAARVPAADAATDAP